ncbi:RING-H2 finger protein ATL79-like [Aristolochia californica]|uniref:RING-H2 finger protein ATL79-like n=1 Tax=Aristolochia californica TaxID=171875 RepID=UPI0035DF8F5B
MTSLPFGSSSHSSSTTSSSMEKNDHWFPYSNSGDFDTNLAMILVILVCSLAGVLALNAFIRCFLRRQAQLDSGGLPETHVTKLIRAPPVPVLPTLVFSAGMKLAGVEAECAICLSEFVNGEKVRVLPKCNHGFHDKCIEGWLSSKASCPTCRRSCLSPERDVAGGNGTETLPEAMTEP